MAVVAVVAVEENHMVESVYRTYRLVAALDSVVVAVVAAAAGAFHKALFRKVVASLD